VLVSPGLSRRLDIAYHFCEIHEPPWASGSPRGKFGANRINRILPLATATLAPILSARWDTSIGPNHLKFELPGM